MNLVMTDCRGTGLGREPRELREPQPDLLIPQPHFIPSVTDPPQDQKRFTTFTKFTHSSPLGGANYRFAMTQADCRPGETFLLGISAF